MMGCAEKRTPFSMKTAEMRPFLLGDGDLTVICVVKLQ